MLPHLRINNNTPEKLAKRLQADVTPLRITNDFGIDFALSIQVSQQFARHLFEKESGHIKRLKIVQMFVQSVSQLLLVRPDNLSVEITSVPSLFLFARTKDFTIYLESFFDEGTGKHEESVLNVFRNKEIIFSDGGNLETMLKALDHCFEPPQTNYSLFLSSSYGVSGGTATQTQLSQNSKQSVWTPSEQEYA
jgi:hypothetical protein